MKGHVPNGNRKMRKIAVSMPVEVFAKIAKRAKVSGTSFSEQAVDILKCGLFDLEESERYDPVEKTSHA